MTLSLALLVPLALFTEARAGDLKFSYPTNLSSSQKPSITVIVPRPVDEMAVDCTAGAETLNFHALSVPAGQRTFSWNRDPEVTHATCVVQAQFSDGFTEGVEVELDYSYGPPLKVDLSKAGVDIKAHTLTVSASGAVDTATIIAYGVGKAVLDEQEVPIKAGPGSITIPWVGEASEVVLLDITLRQGSSWAGFTFSPWILDIPHDDVLFASDSDLIDPSEEWKLQKTLEQLHDVVARYGDLLPVKLYVAGCTDTVGNPAHNKDLSNRRARSIARWLKGHGFTYPIFFHGFGESLLAVKTPDETDSPANRRAIYIVSSNPPPAGSDVPQVTWSPLP